MLQVKGGQNMARDHSREMPKASRLCKMSNEQLLDWCWRNTWKALGANGPVPPRGRSFTDKEWRRAAEKITVRGDA
jgi:hypothetical protein